MPYTVVPLTLTESCAASRCGRTKTGGVMSARTVRADDAAIRSSLS